ncbi:MAG: hypothetical protein K0Q53_2227 [Massilibacillus sp.]|jgi:hypothetical protein|nr:hypothetical protein [Massilibacillus sp.]
MRIRRDKKVTQATVDGNKEIIFFKEAPKPINKTIKFTKRSAEFIQKIIQNPNFIVQLLVVVFTLTSENDQMDRKFEGVSSTVDKIKNITDILNSTMHSVKIAAEAPEKIRQIL